MLIVTHKILDNLNSKYFSYFLKSTLRAKADTEVLCGYNNACSILSEALSQLSISATAG